MGSNGDVLSLQIRIGVVEGLVERDQVGSLSRCHVRSYSLDQSDDALVHQFLFHVGLFLLT